MNLILLIDDSAYDKFVVASPEPGKELEAINEIVRSFEDANRQCFVYMQSGEDQFKDALLYVCIADSPFAALSSFDDWNRAIYQYVMNCPDSVKSRLNPINFD